MLKRLLLTGCAVSCAVLAASGAGGAAITRLTTSPAFDGESSFSPDGMKIAFASERRLIATGVGRDVFTVARNGASETNVTCQSSCGDVTAAWPQWTDGTHIVYESNAGIVLTGSDGTGSHVVYPGVGRFPHGLANGRIAFLGDMGVGTVNQDGTGLATLADGEGYPLNLPQSASTVAYTSRADGSLHVLNADGSGDTTVTTFPSLYAMPSPDGSKVAFIHYDDASAQYDLYVISRDGTGLERLTNDAYIENETMSWAPNGRSIAFYRSTNPDGSGNDIVVLNVDGHGVQQFGSTLSDDLYPRFAPDGEAVTFTSDYGEPGNYDVYTADVADLEQTTAPAGGTVSTNTAAGPSSGDRVQTSVTTPLSGDVSIRETGATGTPPAGYAFGSEQVEITAPVATAATPLQITFRLDASALAGATYANLVVFRDGTAVPACLLPPGGAASPDPCVSSRQALPGGGAQVIVLTSHASTWNFGAKSGFDFSGFFAPVDNPPALNASNAGSSVPVKFSLHGDQGLDIFAAGFPASHQISCDPNAPVSTVDETVAATSKSLSYDAASDQYTFVWRTNKAWSSTCRQLVVRLTDGSDHVANFKFK
jgi:Tol biopolymer transport system component